MTSYGAVVAGAGLGGMTAALYLAGRGIRTLVLEQNHQPGGNMAGFRRGDFYFDGGDQSFESLGIVFPLFEEMGILDKIRFHRARFRMKSPDFDFFVDSFEGVEEALSLAFPREKGIHCLFREIRETSRFIETHCSPWSFPLLHDFSFGRLARASLWLPKFRRWLTYEYRKKACAVLQDERLRNWFTGIGYYKMPFIFFAGFWHLWMKDYWYPEGGMNRLYAVLKERLVELGGEILLGKRLVKIEHSPKRASSFITADGDVFCAERFIYTGDYKRLVREIAPGLFRPSFVRAAEEAKLTEELVSVYLGLDMDREELSRVLGSQHVFYFPNYDVTFPDASSPEDVHAKMWLLVNHFGE
ncbi:MAG: FAD-dependent oxidoreductase, partial [Spirochaetales bacterium]|nr:FAD-dependent oxidoreductase [Spirochaetales bacterium]